MTIDLGFLHLLTILLIGLKLTGFIGWSWLWVLAPIWLPIGLVMLFGFICWIAVKFNL